MAQYWLEIASSADLDQLEVVTTGSLSYTTDGGIPVAVFTSTSAVGEYVRLLGVPSSAVINVRALYRQTNSSLGASRTGPAARISGGNGYIYGKNTTTTYRASRSVSGAWAEISNNILNKPAGNTWSWLEIGCNGTSVTLWDWAYGAEKGSATGTITDTNLASGVAGFGAPGAAACISHIRIISVGTDGDPAPTGPVGGRQRSRLILTPW